MGDANDSRAVEWTAFALEALPMFVVASLSEFPF